MEPSIIGVAHRANRSGANKKLGQKEELQHESPWLDATYRISFDRRALVAVLVIYGVSRAFGWIAS